MTIFLALINIQLLIWSIFSKKSTSQISIIQKYTRSPDFMVSIKYCLHFLFYFILFFSFSTAFIFGDFATIDYIDCKVISCLVYSKNLVYLANFPRIYTS